MTSRLVLFLHHASFEPAHAATALAVTAAAMGQEVTLVLGFEPLRALCEGRFGAPDGRDEVASHRRAGEIGAALPDRMLREARSLGARLVACDTTARLSGVDSARLDELEVALEGLPTVWSKARGAQLLSF